MKNYQEDEVFGILRNNKNENVFIYNIIPFVRAESKMF